MWERSGLTKKRNVSETTLSSGEFPADFEYCLGGNPLKRNTMDHSSMSSSSESDGEDSYRTATHGRKSKKPKCSSKNAILARQNRIRKKKYLEELENEVKSLRAENSALRTNVDGYSKDMEVVRKENRYLRNVLASRKEISRLLGVIQDKTGLLTSSSLCNTEVHSKREKTSKAHAQSTIASPVQPKETPLSVTLQTGPNMFAESEPVESPITLNDVLLSGPECDDELPVNLFSSDDHDYLNFDTDIPEDWLVEDEELPNLGVCLHVAKKKISLEFCQYCNENASRCWDDITV